MAKQLLPNQHLPLHFLYGKRDCCLCSKDQRIAELEAHILELESKPQPEQCPLCGQRSPLGILHVWCINHEQAMADGHVVDY